MIEELKHSNLKEWNSKVPKVKPDFFIELIPFASNHYDTTYWKEKLHTLINEINDPAILEAAGKQLSLEQLHEILFWHSSHNPKISIEKIAIIFTGVSPTLFFGLLVRISKEQISSLQKIASLPPIEFHLSILSHTIKELLKTLSEKIRKIENAVLKMNSGALQESEINQLYENITTIYHEALEINHVSNSCLSIVWNTNRTDIISELSSTKELCHKCLIYDIGVQEREDEFDRHLIPPTGLWGLLKNKVDDFFSVQSLSGITRMQDDDPALEALNIFSIWHLKDYQEIGLLKGVASSTIHELNSIRCTDSTHQTKQESLFNVVRKNLEESGLKTLKDLKREHIYSKQALIDYISAFENKD